MPTESEIAAEESERLAAEANKALEERISKGANAAVSSHMKRVKPGLTADDLEKWADARDAKRAELDEEKRKAAAAGGSGVGGAQNAPEIAKLQKELGELRKKADAAEAKSAAQEKKAQQDEDKATITKTLEAAGVPAGQRARIALNHLLSEGLVKRTDDGLRFVGAEGEEDLADGITEFLKTEDGKLFLPPSGAGGSGASAFKAGAKGKQGESSKERAGRALSDWKSGTRQGE